MYLNTHSYYSLHYGTLSLQKIINNAKSNDIKTLALTDINNSAAILDFVKLCFTNGIKPVAGIEFRNDYGDLLYIALAKNNEGFNEINEFLSYYNINKEKLPERAPVFENVYMIYEFGNYNFVDLKENEFIGIRPNQVRKLYSANYNIEKLLVLQSITFKNSEEYVLHKHLRAIDKNTLLGKLTESDYAAPDHYFMQPEELESHYQQYPEIIKNTNNLLDSCNFEFDFKALKNKSTYTGNKHDDKMLLEQLVWEGFKYRYDESNTEAKKRLIKELDVIDKLGFSAYYLITWDMIDYAMRSGIFHVGRGSGANSIVAYCLKITNVDPIELNLYFERFLNPNRKSPPDFDIDFSWKDRDFIYDYLFQKYGREHVALLGSMSTFKGKSIIRELAKVYGLPKEEIDAFIEDPQNPDYQNGITQRILKIGSMMEKFPNQRSIHAGGVLISEKPLTYYTALDMPPKDYQTTQWDMYTAEDIGFEKLDVLSQRGIGHIFEAKKIIEQNRGLKIDIHDVERFKNDKKVKSLLRNGEAIGGFYVESPAMRGLLRKLRCDNYLSLVAASSIIRPGVAKSGMMREYIRRFHKPDSFKYLHPIFKEQLSETYGVMVYQEDVLKICHHFAGLDLADADVLRRLMSGKPQHRKKFGNIIKKFFKNCKERNYSDKLTQEVWRQISSFAGYSFSKAHSASYAVESFQSLFLKAYFPREFMVAVINNFGGYYKTWVYFNEAQRWGARINRPCINQSDNFTNIKGKDIYIGFVHVANLEQNLVFRILEEREKNGKFLGVYDFMDRVSVGLEQMNILIRVGAFSFTAESKANLLWETHHVLKKSKVTVEQNTLFSTPVQKYELPEFSQSSIEDAYDEIEFLGFPITISMFDMLETGFRGDAFARDLANMEGQTIRMVGNLVHIKYVRTSKNELMNFGTFIDAKGNFFDTTHFSQSLKNYKFKGDGVYLLKGKITKEFGHPTLDVEKMAKLPIKQDKRFA